MAVALQSGKVNVRVLPARIDRIDPYRIECPKLSIAMLGDVVSLKIGAIVNAGYTLQSHSNPNLIEPKRYP